MPPGRRTSAETCNKLILASNETDLSNHYLGDRYKLSSKTVYRIRLCYELFGTPFAPQSLRRGRRHVLTAHHERLLFEYIMEFPDAYLDEIAWYLWGHEEYGLVVSDWTVWNVLHRYWFSRKVARKIAGERPSGLRSTWQAKRLWWKREKSVFVDESASDTRFGWRKYSWSLVNHPADSKTPTKRLERYSVCPAYTINGYLPGVLIVQGGITKEMSRIKILSQQLRITFTVSFDEKHEWRKLESWLCKEIGEELETAIPRPLSGITTLPVA